MDLVAKGHILEARVFFNSFQGDHEMIYARDLQILEGALSPSHLEELKFARALRQSKVSMKICQYSYNLPLQYLHKSQTLNQLLCLKSSMSTSTFKYIDFKIQLPFSPGQPSSIADDAEFVALYGSVQNAADLINQNPFGGVSVKKLKKDKVGIATTKASRSESLTVSTCQMSHRHHNEMCISSFSHWELSSWIGMKGKAF